MNEDLQILAYFIATILAVALIVAPIILLIIIRKMLQKILTSIEAIQYLFEKHDQREDEKSKQFK